MLLWVTSLFGIHAQPKLLIIYVYVILVRYVMLYDIYFRRPSAANEQSR